MLYENSFGRFQSESGQGNILKPIIGNESLHEISNDNGTGVVRCEI
jgi:hypothetical protein